MGLSAEVVEGFVKGCTNQKSLERIAAAVAKRLADLEAKVATKQRKKSAAVK